MDKPGIKSYKHLNEVIIEVLKNSEKALSAAQIANTIEDHYKTKKVFVKSLSIAKRCQGHPNVKREKKPRGYVYSYVGDE